MSRDRLTFGLLALAVTLAAGCSTSARRDRPTYVRTEHLIFNPDGMGVTPRQVARSDWPATSAYIPGTERIEYRETVIDWQGRSGFDTDNDYRRRFRSTRTGRAHQ